MCTEKIKLVTPTKDFATQVMGYKKIFLENGATLAGCADLERCKTYEEWCDFENRLQKFHKDEYVPSTIFLAVRKSDNKLIGIIDFKHKLTDFLSNYGGNIGYSVLPAERRKGYAKEMLKLMLQHCKKMGYDKILVTCDKENIASAKTIIANGGILENEIADKSNLSKSGMIQRYWINL